ncbi:sulfate reduction electron transfer complex DsrMKJOP subunit DsrP [Prosthecochloris sp. HL-130-GSB]|jgi:Ni/Fe-hydrogenase subunit HybB-like protein|uniref:sulfate reduction electron transfer complex DsrMKJOP subunit DsrP n=1 Tax=Prosthecochloris sp. HL-130-GSB TaxID=1974213 RepID=UPI000A1C0B18|nr:NrfD/PsrC family molybdoenzyme membrane anchor subunit [Prosthecochloris sp. HL-130-GSB]ARM30055.1 menaquinol oxidoreductase [Prosthecochloris sp. HL-130-GSB]MBO8092336.1 polysulfide reductase NrfD [Prosthecochloris sp.]
MIEKALKGNRSYWAWIAFLIACIGLGLNAWAYQLEHGLGVTGMGRDISWGLYIAQFTFLVGVAASAVMVVLPYYLHNRKEFGKIVIVGEFLAVSAAVMCMLFILADLGKPQRVLNVLRYPTPNSMVFWDVVVLNGYLLLNLIGGWTVLGAERKGIAPPKWVKPLIYLSIPWAFSIHTVTAFLYAGMPGRHLWLTAVLAPRFLASAFAAGTAILILISFILKRTSGFDAGTEVRKKLTVIAAYAGIANFFLLGMEFFTAFYSNVPAHMHSLQYLYFGLHGQAQFVPWMWLSLVVGLGAVAVLLVPSLRSRTSWLIAACSGLVVSIWIDKGVGLIIGGFNPTPFEHIVRYAPTVTEISVALGIWAIGLLLLTMLLKVAVAVKTDS